MTFTSILKKLIKSAILAPSGHNSQPWKFELTSNSIKIFPDFSYHRPQVDPDNRELYVSLGAASANLEIAAQAAGLIFEKKYFFNNNHPSIEFIFSKGKTIPQNVDLFKVINLRHTNRFPFLSKSISKSILDQIHNQSFPGAIITPIKSVENRRLLSKLVYDSELIWFKSKDLVTELEGWLRDDLSSSKDGLPTGVLNLYKLAVNLKMYLKKNSPDLIIKSSASQELAASAPILYIVSSTQDNLENWIKVGEGYQRFILFLTSFGLAHGYFNAVIELNTLRTKLAKTFKLKSSPQMLLRVGYPQSIPPRSPRRPLASFIVRPS